MYYNMGDHIVVRRHDVTTWNPRFPPQGREHLSAVLRTVLITLLGKTELRHSSLPGSAAWAADPSFPSCSPQSRETRLKAEAQPKNWHPKKLSWDKSFPHLNLSITVFHKFQRFFLAHSIKCIWINYWKIEYSQFFACSWFWTCCIISWAFERNYIDCSVNLTNYLGDREWKNREFSIDKYRNLSLSFSLSLSIYIF